MGQAVTPIDLHSHHAIQVGVGLPDQVQFRTSDATAWERYSCAVIPPNLPHAFQAPGKMVANLFCEPESALGQGLLSRFGREHIAGVSAMEISRYARALRFAFDDGRSDDDLEDVALDALYALSGSVPASPVDRRIHLAIAYIAANLAQPLSLQTVARHVELSPGRLRHLFVEETGISFRSYLLWIRLNRALELGFGGTSWTEAALAANFADSAHLSRTARRMYGIAPSSIRQTVSPAVRPMTA